MTMGLKDIIRAIREYPTAHAELEAARFELRQAQQALEQSEPGSGIVVAGIERTKGSRRFPLP